MLSKKSSSERYERTEKTTTSKSSYSRSSKTSSKSSNGRMVQGSAQQQNSIQASADGAFDYNDNLIESYLQAEPRKFGTTPISFKSLKSPHVKRKQMQSPVKDGFQKVTVSSGSNKIDHYSKTFSSDEDDDVFVRSRGNTPRQQVDEDVIMAADFSGHDLSGERSYEDIYGYEDEHKNNQHYTVGQPVTLNMANSSYQDDHQPSSPTPDIIVDRYQTPPPEIKQFQPVNLLISTKDKQRSNTNRQQSKQHQHQHLHQQGQHQKQQHQKQRASDQKYQQYEPVTVELGIESSEQENQQGSYQQYKPVIMELETVIAPKYDNKDVLKHKQEQKQNYQQMSQQQHQHHQQQQQQQQNNQYNNQQKHQHQQQQHQQHQHQNYQYNQQQQHQQHQRLQQQQEQEHQPYLEDDTDSGSEDSSYHQQPPKQQKRKTKTSPRDFPTYHIELTKQSDYTNDSNLEIQRPVPVDVSPSQPHKSFHIKNLPVDITVKREGKSLTEPEKIRVLVSPTPMQQQQEMGFVPVHRQEHQQQKVIRQELSSSQSSIPKRVKPKPRRNPQPVQPVTVKKVDIMGVYNSFHGIDKDLYDEEMHSDVHRVVSNNVPQQQRYVQQYEYSHNSYSDQNKSVGSAHISVKNSQLAKKRQIEEQRRREEEILAQRQQEEAYQRQQRIEIRKQQEAQRRGEEEMRMRQEEERLRQMEEQRRREDEILAQRQQEEAYQRQQRIEIRKQQEAQMRVEEELIRQEEEMTRQTQEIAMRQRQEEMQKRQEEEMRRKNEELRKQKEGIRRQEEIERKQHEEKARRIGEQRIAEHRRMEDAQRRAEEKFQRQVLETENRRKAAESFQQQQYQKSIQRSKSQSNQLNSSSEGMSESQMHSTTVPRHLKKIQQREYKSHSASNTPEIRRRGSESDASKNAIIARTDIGSRTIMASRIARPKSVDTTRQIKTLPRNFKRSSSQGWLAEQPQQSKSQHTSQIQNSSYSSSTHQEVHQTSSTRIQSSTTASRLPRTKSTTAIDEERLAHAQQKHLAKQDRHHQGQQAFLRQDENSSSKHNTEQRKSHKSSSQRNSKQQHTQSFQHTQGLYPQGMHPQGFMSIPKQQSFSSEQSQKGNLVQYGDHSNVKIISGSHMNDTSSHVQRAMAAQQSNQFNRNETARSSVQSKAYMNMYHPAPAPPKPTRAIKKPAVEQPTEKFESIKVVAKGGQITLTMDEEDLTLTESEKQRLATNVYTTGYHSNNYSSNYYNSMQSSHRNQQQSLSNEENNSQQQYGHQEEQNSSKDQSSIQSKVATIRSGDWSGPTDVVYYTVCTRYFKPEMHDWITNIHRMGKTKVPAGLTHESRCIFWQQLYDPDREDIIVQKIIPPENYQGSYYDRNNNSFGQTKQMDNNNNYMSQSFEDDSQERLNAQNNLIDSSFDSDAESQTSSVSAYSASGRRRSSARLLRKTHDNPGVSQQNVNDHTKYMPIRQAAY